MYGQGPIREWMGGGTAGNSQGPSGKINLRTSIYFEDLHNQSWKRMKNSDGRVIFKTHRLPH